jgi:hypothetical protein
MVSYNWNWVSSFIVSEYIWTLVVLFGLPCGELDCLFTILRTLENASFGFGRRDSLFTSFIVVVLSTVNELRATRRTWFNNLLQRVAFDAFLMLFSGSLVLPAWATYGFYRYTYKSLIAMNFRTTLD